MSWVRVTLPPTFPTMHECGLTWRAAEWLVLFSGPGQLEQREQAERVPVQVIVGVELGLLSGRSVPGAVREAQMIADLPHIRSRVI